MSRSHKPPSASELCRAVHEAVGAVGPLNCVMLDASAEALLVAEHLLALPRLIVTTPGLDVALYLSEMSTHTVVLLGGEVHRPSRSVLVDASFGGGPTIDIGFFGAASYTPAAGLMERDFGLAASKRRLVAQCRLRYGVLRANKVETFGPYTFLPRAALTQLIVLEDDPSPPEGIEEPGDRTHRGMRSPPSRVQDFLPMS